MEPRTLNSILEIAGDVLCRHFIVAALVAFALGYLVREIISRHRRKKFRRRHPNQP
jgi:hypothetical protein